MSVGQNEIIADVFGAKAPLSERAEAEAGKAMLHVIGKARRCAGPDAMRHRLLESNEEPSNRKSTGDFQDIKRAVAEYYGITITDLCNGGRSVHFSHPRQVAWSLIRDLRPKVSLPAIGRAFGRRDHTTVLSGLKAIEARDCPLEAEAIKSITNTLRGGVFRSNRALVFKSNRTQEGQ